MSRGKRSTLFVALQQCITLAAHVVQIVVLSRLLDPRDYGLAAEAGIIFTFANVFKDLGFSAAAIQSPNLTKQDSNNLFWVGMTFALAISLLIVASGPLVAIFYKESILSALILVMGITFVISSLGNQPIALAQRDFKFKEVALWSMAAKTLGLITGCVMAANSFGPWAIIWMHFIEAAIVTMGGFITSRFVPGWMHDLASSRQYLSFGALLSLSGLLSFVSRNLDKILIGKLFGPESLGFYTRAHGLLIFPLTAILSGFNRLNLASLSRLTEQPEKYNSHLNVILQAYFYLTAMLIVPAVVCAKDVIELAMGPKWLAVVPIFQVMAPYAAYQIVSYGCNLTLISNAHMAKLTKLHLLNCLTSILAIVIAVPFGLIGLAASFALTGIVVQQTLFIWFASQTAVLNTQLFIKTVLRLFLQVAGVTALCFLIKGQLELQVGNYLQMVLVGLVSSSVLLLCVWYSDLRKHLHLPLNSRLRPGVK
jgi:polysaccharide transporter, PST family